MSATAGKTGAATKPAVNKRPVHGPGKISFGLGGPSGSRETMVTFLPSLKRLLRIVRPHRITAAVALVPVVGAVMMSTLGPRTLGTAAGLLLAGAVGRSMSASVTKEQVTEAARNGGNDILAEMLQRVDFTPGQGIDFGAIGSILVLVLVLYVAPTVATYASNWPLIGTTQKLVRRMRSDVGAKLQCLPLSHFNGRPRGELLFRVTNDIDNVSQTLIQALSQLINSLLMVFGVVIIMMWISWPLAPVALVSVPLPMLTVPLIVRRSQRRFTDIWKPTGELNSEIEEAYTGRSSVKVFGHKPEAEATLRIRNEALFKLSFGTQLPSGIFMSVMSLVGNLSYTTAAISGGLQVTMGQMNIGDAQALIQCPHQFTQPLTRPTSTTNLPQSGVASAKWAFELLDADEMSPEPGRGLAVEGGHVVSEDITFSYSPDRPLIEHFSLEAEPGQTVAIVDPTGVDETMLAGLLIRFCDLNPGRILLDRTDIMTVDRRALRDSMSMVLQDTWLFDGTIHDNIAYGKEGATQGEILAAAGAAFVDRSVHPLPDGYSTIIDEKGNSVSADEKWLIAIVRVFPSELELLILDEVTSSVDTRTELLLQKAVATLHSGRTSSVITHRLSAIRDANLTLVMDDGAITEQSIHSDLLAARGRYHDLYQSQFNAPAEEIPAP